MTLLGLDFDNTLVRYDNLFHQLALEKDLITDLIPANKIAIRNYLRDHKKEEDFTLLQGEVYGSRILEAEPAEGMLKALTELRQQRIPMVLVSHKTRTPYKGPAFDLHQAAWSWLDKYGFFHRDGMGWTQEQVFFEETKQDKISRIEALGCTHYIDDLPEILDMLPTKIHAILYDPLNSHSKYKGTHLSHWGYLDQSLIA